MENTKGLCGQRASDRKIFFAVICIPVVICVIVILSMVIAFVPRNTGIHKNRGDNRGQSQCFVPLINCV